MMSSIIVTGCTGTLGCAVVRCALDKGLNVTCIVHKGSKRLGNLPKSSFVNIIECDLKDYATLNLSGQYDAFIHLAWEKTFGISRDDSLSQSKNIQYTLDAVNLASRCGCSVFVGAGSQAEYGIKNSKLTPDMPVNPESGYGIAKFAAGKLSAMLCASLGIRHCWVRVLSVYGPCDGPNSLISYLVREFGSGETPKLTNCQQIWDYLFCDDAGSAFIAIAEKGLDGKAYVLGSGHGRSLKTYVEDIREQFGALASVDFGVIDYYPHQPMYMVADISELSKDTGWAPSVAFKEGIRRTVEFNNEV